MRRRGECLRRFSTPLERAYAPVSSRGVRLSRRPHGTALFRYNVSHFGTDRRCLTQYRDCTLQRVSRRTCVVHLTVNLARMAELVDAHDCETCDPLGRPGSNPGSSTGEAFTATRAHHRLLGHSNSCILKHVSQTCARGTHFGAAPCFLAEARRASRCVAEEGFCARFSAATRAWSR